MDNVATNPDRQGIYASGIYKLLETLKEDKVLNKIYAKKVLDNMAIVADNNTLRVEDAGKRELSNREQTEVIAAIDKAVQNV